ncbi:hypothetical protein Dda_4318 [Drechslerella dactyloides]|uniref:ferroxidase n=1 Tax=Drechslerella dactyloides TaxID=74499 RepID=A0AAD6J125_DREDA|nr:hypothetical protein Dda_4318 [Drechslerella dactyloides]
MPDIGGNGDIPSSNRDFDVSKSSALCCRPQARIQIVSTDVIEIVKREEKTNRLFAAHCTRTYVQRLHDAINSYPPTNLPGRAIGEQQDAGMQPKHLYPHLAVPGVSPNSGSTAAARPVCAATQHSRRLHTTPRCLAATGYTGPAAGISMEEYHQLADRTMNELFDRLEALVEEKDGFDVEFHADVLELETPNGTYVFNKQPPNKQIWLSSPVSGPKRYSWQDEQQEWVYTNTGSTLRELLREEVGVEIGESSAFGRYREMSALNVGAEPSPGRGLFAKRKRVGAPRDIEKVAPSTPFPRTPRPHPPSSRAGRPISFRIPTGYRRVSHPSALEDPPSLDPNTRPALSHRVAKPVR